MTAMDEQTRHTVRDLVLDEDRFRRLTLNTGRQTTPDAWRRVVVRPVQLRGRRHLQFSYFDARQDVTKNYAGPAATRRLEELLHLPVRAISVQSAHQTLNVQITKSGKAILHRLPPAGASATSLPSTESAPPEAPVADEGAAKDAAESSEPEVPVRSLAEPGPDLRHNRRKEHPLPEGVPDPLLQALEIMDAEGRVRAGMRGKFTQVNEFLKLLEHSGALEAAEGRPLRLLDGASGSSYLSFAAYHYLNDVRHIPATLVGVDVNEKLVAKGNALAGELGYSGIRFVASSIAAYEGEPPPDVVLALHACDTATDEAIARGIAWGARAILAVPCCQHDLNQQLRRTGAPASQPFAPVLRHGILKERLADILTDAFRAHLLRLAGYDTDVVEFVSTEHSGRNLMIRAVRRPGAHVADAPHAEGATTPADSRARSQRQRLAADYEALRALWGVTPYLETLLDKDLLAGPGDSGTPGGAGGVPPARRRQEEDE
jgi:hypothetical protein